MEKIATAQTDSGIKSAACIQLHFELYWFWNLFAGRLLALLLLRLPFPQHSRTAAQRPVFRLSVGTLGCAAKAAQTANMGATVRESHFAVHLFPKST